MSTSHVVITILDGEQKGVAFKFDKTPVTIGRHEDDDVYIIFDNTVSRHHARITEEGDSYFIERVHDPPYGSKQADEWGNTSRCRQKVHHLFQPGDFSVGRFDQGSVDRLQV